MKDNKFSEEFLEHLANIAEAEQKFKDDPCTETATQLSNLKNNMFKDPFEVFDENFLEKKMAKFTKKRVEMGYLDYELRIVYNGYDPRPVNLVADYIREE